MRNQLGTDIRTVAPEFVVRYYSDDILKYRAIKQSLTCLEIQPTRSDPSFQTRP
jgi:hypothetical protein